MNLFIDALSARDGGGVTYIHNLLSSLPKSNNLKIYILVQKKLKLDILDKRVFVLKAFAFLDNPVIRFVWQSLFLRRYLKKLKINSLFVPGGICFTRPPKNCNLITIFRNMLPFDSSQLQRYPLSIFKIKLLLTKFFILKSLKIANSVIYISKFGRNFIRKNYSHLSHKYIIIPHGIDNKFYQKKKKERFKLCPKGKYILYVSRLEYYKNQLQLIKAFSKIIFKSKFDLKLLLVGPKNTDYGKKVENHIKRHNLAEEVHLLGNINHDYLPKLYQNAEINIFLSEVENCPNILLEALAANKPILCSNKQPMIEFGGESPFYCNPRNIVEIENGIKKILNNKSLSKKKSLEGFKRSKLYSKNNSINNTWHFLLNEE
ncbi:MAG: hypothetical protein CMN44_09725 [SAR116 cluster bacterium]|nr:hypothetical protein [SAR116 cluster bacterium]RPH08178.1 MAG: glycosyltransferase family 1 protein [Alphaproteobacteria bacterium TMED54]